MIGRSPERLQLRWALASGDVDHYEVQLLFNDMKVFPPLTLGAAVGRCVLTALTPGRLYKVLVSTFSGPHQRAQFIEGRTGEPIQHTTMSLRAHQLTHPLTHSLHYSFTQSFSETPLPHMLSVTLPRPFSSQQGEECPGE